jgi:hypothetical protein
MLLPKNSQNPARKPHRVAKPRWQTCPRHLPLPRYVPINNLTFTNGYPISNICNVINPTVSLLDNSNAGYLFWR